MAGGTRFHQAAQDGNLDILKEATKRDTNAKDEDGMTPVLWAASCGQLDALRLLVGRGGDVEKANYHFGQSALHLAAMKGHLPCVSFLVGFDANLFALDHDLHTPLQVATHPDVIEFLDKSTTSQLLNNKKEVKVKKEKALKDAERRKKKYDERMKKERDKEEKRIKKVEKEIGSKIETDTPIPTIPNSTIRKTVVEVNGPSFTEIVGGTLTKKPSAVKKILDKKLRLDDKNLENGGKGNRRDAQIIYVSNYDNPNCGKRGKISDIFSSQMSMNGLNNQASIFDRPGFGSVAFRQRANLAGTLSGNPGDVIIEKEVEEDGSEGASIGSAGSLGQPRNNRWQPSWVVDTTSDEENEVANGQWTPLERFLVSAGVEEYKSQLLAQQIDLEAVLMLTEQDLVELGFPMGPRKKLLHAVKQRRQALSNPGKLGDTRL
ncbi:ANK [Nesidiocoris tenuis]|uniref:ANK n=1 Tax=Nesidiocoris tenuis TaxID=355587 RepID=A0ABN7B583_9HEMI|nr:ANK [Nesidiocoris tenuis]